MAAAQLDAEQPFFTASYARSTKYFTFDEEFFLENDLLLVDICRQNALELEIVPERYALSNGQVSLVIRYGARVGTAANSEGRLFLLPIPKGCESAQVDLVAEPKWSESTSSVLYIG